MEELMWYLIITILVYAVIGGIISEIKERIDNKRYEQFLKENPEAQELLNKEMTDKALEEDCGKHARREKIIVRDTGKTKVKEGDRYCSRCGCLLDWEDSENE